MKRSWLLIAGLVTLVALLGTTFLFLPSVGARIFLSPDETAVAASVRSFVETKSFSIIDPIFFSTPWAHPRSFVVTENRMVPVGFLGMPALLVIPYRALGGYAFMLFTPLLALLTVIPLLSFTKKWGRLGQLATIVGWMTFPLVILYANRGLFPNLPVICLTIWAAWIIWRSEDHAELVIAGILAGMALLIRPIEAVWVLPWVAYAFIDRERGTKQLQRWNAALYIIVPLFIVCLVGAWIGKETYGQWLISGYQLRDPIINAGAEVTTVAPAASKSWFESWPFGFHPRNVLFNVRAYLMGYLFPWFLLMVGTVLLLWREKTSRRFILLAAYTIGVLSLIYGQALYQDHVRINHVSLANSFLRYLLPVSVFAALSLGWFVSLVRRSFPRYGMVFALIVTTSMGLFGWWTAFARDDEGLIQNRIELLKYTEVRREAASALDPLTIVFSERSDKLFFPIWRAVSPMPTKERLHELLESGKTPVAFFLRTAMPEQIESWRVYGFKLEPVFEAGNETLYRVTIL
ncbi:MAG: hypothetical protein WC787_05005 [Patescibacteria group bacterium]|jgi:hypothetical protein